MNSEKNKLVSLPGALAHPATLTGNDFPSPGGDKAGMAEGANKLIMDSTNQCGPRHTEDGGPGKSGAGTPVPVMRSKAISSNFKIEQNMGEGSDKPSAMTSSYDEVDKVGGQIVPNVKMDRSN